MARRDFGKSIIRRIIYSIIFITFGGSSIVWGAPLSEDFKYVESPKSWSLGIDYGYVVYGRYQLSEDTLLRKHGHAVRLSFEGVNQFGWGKWGLGASIGYYQSLYLHVESGKLADLYTFPLGVYFKYSFDQKKNQLLVPFVRVGLGFTWVRQFSRVGVGRPEKGSLSWDYSLGIAICLNRINPRTTEKFDKSTGVNDTYITIEYAQTNGFTQSHPNVTNYAYRIGFRFEI